MTLPSCFIDFISPHAPTGGDATVQDLCAFRNISTHALTEGDKYEEEYGVRFHISTHALTEGDVIVQNHATWNQFQLTPSRRATCTSSDHPNPSVYFNSRPHGGRR